MERLTINERISAARERMEAEGGSWGRLRRLDDAQVARVLQLRGEGRSLTQIATAMKVPRSVVQRAAR